MPDLTPNREREPTHLRKALGPVMLWGLGVGYVISGEYFGWNLGLPKGGTLGMLLAFVLVTVMYVTFVFSYTEMACAIPRAGGVFVYAERGLGLAGGYLGGIAQVVEFVFAPPAIAMAIGGYVQIWIPQRVQTGVDDWLSGHVNEPLAGALPGWLVPEVSLVVCVAVVAYLIFTGLNVWGVKQAATFELIVTVLAVGGLLLFTGVTAPHARLENFTANGWPHGWSGAIAAIPFAIWFYLAIEGVANAAEEAVAPQRDVARGFGGAMITLVILACLAFFCSVAVGGWERVVYPAEQLTAVGENLVVADPDATSDRPLPMAMEQILGRDHLLYHALVGIGLLGLIASFNGIILASGRALFEMGRVGFFPRFIGRAHRKTQTPVNALGVNFVIGLAAILFFDTGGLITLAAFGAVTLYIVSMIALIRLRRKEPTLPRPYRTPLYPVFPIIALVIAAFSLATMAYFSFDLEDIRQSHTLWYFGYLAVAFAYYLFIRPRLSEEDIAHFRRID